MTITVHESNMTAAMAKAILNGSAEGDKEDARRNLNRLYSEWVVKFNTKDGRPYTMKIVGAEDEDQAWKMALQNADKNGGGDLIDKTAPLNIDYIQKWESKVREANAIPDKTLLCQESKKSESEQVCWDDDFDMTSAAHDRLYNAIMKNPKGFTGGDAGYMLAEFVKDHKDLILAKFIQDVTLDLDHALYAVDNKYEWMEACFDRAVENM